MPPSLSTLAAQIARGDVFHVIDTETTGHAPPAARVIEIACVSFVQGREVGRFETLIDPGVPIPPFITRLTGIRPAMVVGQPSPDAAIRSLAAYMAPRPGHFVAHNVAFDARFLAWEFERWRQPWPFLGRWCTVRLARQLLPGLRRYNLDALIRHYALSSGPRHRAMGDVEATAQAFWRMAEGLEGGAAFGQEGPEAGHGRGAEPWGLLLERLAERNRPFAALLAQHGVPSGPGPDGLLSVALKERLLRWASPERVAELEGLARDLYGGDCRVRIEVAPLSAGPAPPG